ncbi:hypothetical protein AC578_4081 [Pseudocercospora eumusae]|uniref:Uncharacterized protein n=1 Tax=Pseudocercospora eumusae TaxID=321146 RepID=A0A139HDJ9_9PEZI|nr:hypothetical protein AC578_4081 [Pseudocercospora eumusae]
MPHTRNKLSICLLLLRTVQWTSATITRPPEANYNNLTPRSFNVTAALALPPCVRDCGQKILPLYSCLPGDPCYCNRTGPVQTALSACVKSNCTSLSAKLAGAKFTADTCKYPKPNLGPTTSATADTLFSLATFFVAARMLSRWKKVGGAGYWWDDFVAALLYLPTVALLVVTHFTVRNGSGQDVWQLSVERITKYMEWFLVGQVMVFIVIVIATFLVGGLATVCSVMRVYYLYETFGTTNVTHEFSHAGLWGVIELNASVITCCMPPTAGLAKRIWREMYKTCRDSIQSLTSSRTDQTDYSGDTHIGRGDGHLPEQEKSSEWFDRSRVEKGGSWSETLGSGICNDGDQC